MNRLKNYISNRIKDMDIEFFLFVLFLVFMGIYYIGRIASKAPWYDELYTYYYFVSNGPIYSAIHWPVPNNHIGYSVLSGFIYVLTHSGYISLRLVSCLAATINLILIFMICRKIFSRGYALPVCALYSAMWLVNNLAVQGRGYTLATTMMLSCIYCMICIVYDVKPKEKYYVWWAICLCMGFYIVTSSLYWVVPVCVCAGVLLLVYKKYKELIRLIVYSVFAALGTLFLYTVVWLAIGSNLLIKENATYSNMSHAKLILHHPLASAGRGIEYMLATPYIQSVSRTGYTQAFCEHWKTLISQLLGYEIPVLIGILLSVLLATIVIVSRVVYISKHRQDTLVDDERGIGLLCAAIMVVAFVSLTPIVVYAQCKLPYYRVFSFYGVFISLALVFFIYVLFGNLKPYFSIVFSIIAMVFSFTTLSGADYNGSYGIREENALDILSQDCIRDCDNVIVTDCNLEYMYKFVYDHECGVDATALIENPVADSILIVYNDMLDANAEFSWENYYDYDTLGKYINDFLTDKLENVELNLTKEYRNEDYTLYVFKK